MESDEVDQISGRMPARLREEVMRAREGELGPAPWKLRASVATWMNNRSQSPRAEEQPSEERFECSFLGATPSEDLNAGAKPLEELDAGLILELEEAALFERSVSTGKEIAVWGREVSTGSTAAPGSEVNDLDEMDEMEILEPDDDEIFQWHPNVSICCGHETVSFEALSITDSPAHTTLDNLSVESLDGASSVDSVNLWSTPEETVIFFDFDDTLCPTTWITSSSFDVNRGCSDQRSQTILDSLERHDVTVSSLLRVAARHGHVALVTLATRAWIDRAVRTYLPRLAAVLAELQIGVHCAREAISPYKYRGAVADGLDPMLLMKRECMRQLLRQFYSQRPRQSWKNCVCIGDSLTERDALDELAFTRKQLDKNGLPKPMRCKTVKLFHAPDLHSLTKELETITVCFQHLVEFNGDVAYDLRQIGEHGVADFLRELSNPTTPV